MSSRYRDDRFKGQKDQRQNPRYPSEDVRKAPYQPGDIQRKQREAQDVRRRYDPVHEVRRQRYQQETLAGDWQEYWNRTPYDNRNDRRFTAGQGILILVILMLVLALAGMILFWYIGRSSLRNSGGSGTVTEQNMDAPAGEEMPDDNIIILDISNEE